VLVRLPPDETRLRETGEELKLPLV